MSDPAIPFTADEEKLFRRKCSLNKFTSLSSVEAERIFATLDDVRKQLAAEVKALADERVAHHGTGSWLSSIREQLRRAGIGEGLPYLEPADMAKDLTRWKSTAELNHSKWLMLAGLHVTEHDIAFAMAPLRLREMWQHTENGIRHGITQHARKLLLDAREHRQQTATRIDDLEATDQ